MVAFRNENGKSYSQTYKKTMHNILSAIFNHACRFYNLKSNPARQAGNMGREEKKETLFWTTEEYKKFSEAVIDSYENVSDSVKADVFGFDIADVGGSIRLFSDVMKKLGMKLDGDELYEEFQRIYDERVSRDTNTEKAKDKIWDMRR